MKKIILAICLAFLSVGAFANDTTNSIVNVAETTTSNVAEIVTSNDVETKINLRKTLVADYIYTSSCGEYWEVHL